MAKIMGCIGLLGGLWRCGMYRHGVGVGVEADGVLWVDWSYI